MLVEVEGLNQEEKLDNQKKLQFFLKLNLNHKINDLFLPYIYQNREKKFVEIL